MKFVDSLVASSSLMATQNNFVEARTTVNREEYSQIERIFQSILDNVGCLNSEQQQLFRKVQRIVPKFRRDWRYKDMEREAKETLLNEALRLNPTRFEDLFPTLKAFLRKHSLQRIFDQVYLALYYSKEVGSPYKLDFVTRIYLERMSTVFDLLKPYLTKKQIDKWEKNIARKLKRF